MISLQLTRLMAFIATFLLTMSGHAALVLQGDGTVYDEDLNIYWLQDANLAASETFGVPGIESDGRMLWDTAVAWVAAMNSANHRGHSDWRLVDMDRNGDEIVIYCTFDPANCSDNEYGFLFHQEGISYFTPGPFFNVQNDTLAGYYWSGTEYLQFYAWWFRITLGGQNVDPKQDASALHYVWPVRDGDGPGTLSVAKESVPATVSISSPYRYTLTTINNAGTPAENITLTDPLPAGVTLGTPLPPECTEAIPGTVTCALGILNSGFTKQIELNVIAPSTPGVISNTATVTAADGSSASGQTDTEVTPSNADVGVEKNAPAEAEAGATDYSYSITVYNDGPGTAIDVDMSDSLPDGMTFESATSTRGSCSHDPGTNTVDCSIGALDMGLAALVTIDAVPTRVGTIRNTAYISSAGFDANSDNDASTSDTLFTLADASITDTVGSNDDRLLDFGLRGLGQSVTGEVTVSNIGTSALSVGVSPVSLQEPFWMVDQNCDGAALAPGETCTLVIEFLPVEIDSYTDGFDLQIDAITAAVDLSGTGGQFETDIEVIKDADEAVLEVGDTTMFRINVHNLGGVAADVEVFDKLPAPLRIDPQGQVSASRGQYVDDVWQVDELGPGEDADLEIPVIVDREPPGDRTCILNTAIAEIVSPDVEDPFTGNNTGEKLVSVGGCADLSVVDIEQFFDVELPASVSLYGPETGITLNSRDSNGRRNCPRACEIDFNAVDGDNVAILADQRWIGKVHFASWGNGGSFYAEFDPVVVHAIQLAEGSSPAFFLNTPLSLPIILDAQHSFELEVGFRSSELGSFHTGALEVVSSDAIEPVISIQLSARVSPSFGRVMWRVWFENRGPSEFSRPIRMRATLPNGAAFHGIAVREGEPRNAEPACQVSLNNREQTQASCVLDSAYFGQCFPPDRCFYEVHGNVTDTGFQNGFKTTVCSPTEDPLLENNGAELRSEGVLLNRADTNFCRRLVSIDDL